MIDLSFLTEEEQDTIMSVLKRDVALKKAEMQRVQNLHKIVRDKSRLKYLTGEWFYETKQLRHQDRIHGSDVIIAAMRHTHKPLTILEIHQIHSAPEKLSTVSGESKEVFIPSVLRGILQKPPPQAINERFQNQTLHEIHHETVKPVLLSPTKRKNPFNSELNATPPVEQKCNRVFDGLINKRQPMDKVACDEHVENAIYFSEHCYSKLQSPAVFSLVSAEKSGKLLDSETEAEEEYHHHSEATNDPHGHSIHQEELPKPGAEVSIQGTTATSNDSAIYLQNAAFKETVNKEEPGTQRETTESTMVHLSKKLSNVKASWEMENTVNKIFTEGDSEKEDMAKIGLHDCQVVMNHRSSLLIQKEMINDATVGMTQENSFSPEKVTDIGSVGTDTLKPQSSNGTGDVQSVFLQHQIKNETESEPVNPILHQMLRSKDQCEEVRRCPSKTCHPRLIPTESSSPTKSRMQGSPLKTFSIEIHPQTKLTKDEQMKPTQMQRECNPSCELNQKLLTNPKAPTDITPHPLPLHPVDKATYFCNSSPSKQQNVPCLSTSQSKEIPHKKSGPCIQLARSFIPQDYQYYLGQQENAHVPIFQEEKAVTLNIDAGDGSNNALRDFVEKQNDSSHVVQNKLSNSIQNAAIRAMCLSLATSDSNDGSSSPIQSALEHLTSPRRTSNSKSMENLTSEIRKEVSKNDSSHQMNLSVDDVAALSNPKQMTTSLCVPVLQQDGVEIEINSEETMGWRRNTGSSMSDLSLSSDMTLMSPVGGSVNSLSAADIEVQGSIQYAVNYIQKLGEFHIFVVQCRDLAVADTKRNRSDPYVKCYLLPDKMKLGKKKTRVKKKTLNPTYNEILKFNVNMELLKTQNLNVSVWHNDTFGRNSFLGEVDLDLSQWDFGNTEINEYALKKRVPAQTLTFSPSHLLGSKGHIKVALRFLSQTSNSNTTSKQTCELQIWVKDCKNLPSLKGETIDPFLKCTVLPDTSKKGQQKTRVVKRTANPMFNHTMVYDGFRPEDLREVCVELTVWDHDRLNNHYIGGVRLGLGTGRSYGVEVVWMDSTKDEANLWQRMLLSDCEWVEDVLPLRMFVMAKSL